ncbi:DNA/RNA non-specific endonuclease, partial [Mycobacterium tuberculosis]|nr:DNA/RNA non-specific endonuclease [Mycobacterium tuberculosis]
YQGIQPKLPSSLNENTTPLCYTGFMVLYSGVSRTPLWSAEHLTVDRLNKAQQLERVDNFHEDLNLPEDQRARLSDYTGTG